MSSSSVKNANQLLDNAPKVDRALTLLFATGSNVKIDWNNGEFRTDNLELRILFKELTFISHDDRLTEHGETFVVKNFFQFTPDTLNSTQEKYIFQKELGRGRESTVLLAEHKRMGRQFAVKCCFNKSAGRKYSLLFRKLSNIPQGELEAIVLPIDIFEQQVKSFYNADKSDFTFVVFPFQTGTTIRQFLSEKKLLTPLFVREFISQVGKALSTLHINETCHGDLHPENIIINVDAQGNHRFHIVDIGNSTDQELQTFQKGDLEAFRIILATIVAMMPLTRMSIQRHLGAELFTMVSSILNKEYQTIGELMKAFQDSSPFRAYVRRRESFIKEKFKTGEPLALLRHEEITNPEVARDLFVPFEPFFQEFSDFGSAILYGHRGSGKSSYLAALAYLPNSNKPIWDPREMFGVLFACRQGEFKQLRAIPDESTIKVYTRLKHLLITKIIRRTIEILREDAESHLSESGYNLRPLISYLKQSFPGETITPFAVSSSSQLQNIYESLIRYEIDFTDALVQRRPSNSHQFYFIEQTLIDFFVNVRTISSRFSSTRFALLFDDAGEPNVPKSVQLVLNEILRATNDVYCVKVSAERFAYSEIDSDGKLLEPSHDYSKFNLAEQLILRGGQKLDRKEMRNYFKSLVAKRLEGYASTEITDYLGQEDEPYYKFVETLAAKQSAAMYTGWNIVWQVADRTPRHLLELISVIFARAQVKNTSTPIKIDSRIQNQSIRNYSEMKLREIGYLPDKFDLAGETVSVGAHLSRVTQMFGRKSRVELERGSFSRDGRKFREMLAIEIDKGTNLTKKADVVLQSLIRYAIFDDTIFAKTFDGGLQKPIYVLNRIYAPALRLSFRRVTHWRMSSARFIEFLLFPESVEQNLEQPSGGRKQTPHEKNWFDDQM